MMTTLAAPGCLVLALPVTLPSLCRQTACYEYWKFAHEIARVTAASSHGDACPFCETLASCVVVSFFVRVTLCVSLFQKYLITNQYQAERQPAASTCLSYVRWGKCHRPRRHRRWLICAFRIRLVGRRLLSYRKNPNTIDMLLCGYVCIMYTICIRYICRYLKK